jgi:hypothetical protein
MWPSTWRRNPPPSPRPSPCVKGPKRRVLQPLTRPLACTTHVRQATPRHAQRKSIASHGMWMCGFRGLGQKNPHAEKTACRHACSQQTRVYIHSKTCRKHIATLRSTIVDKPITSLPSNEVGSPSSPSSYQHHCIPSQDNQAGPVFAQTGPAYIHTTVVFRPEPYTLTQTQKEEREGRKRRKARARSYVCPFEP